FLGRAGGDDAGGSRIPQDGGAELLVHQDAGLVLRRAGRECREEAVIDDPFGGGDFCGLRLAQRGLPAEHLRLKRAAMIERLDIEWTVISSRHQPPPFILRWRRISALVELSC